MTDYISREAAKNILKRHEHRFTCADEANGYGNVKWSEYVIYSETAQNCIDALPAADVRENKRGKWWYRPNFVKTEKRKWPVAECDKCGMSFCDVINCMSEMYHYCPNCGADMRGGDA